MTNVHPFPARILPLPPYMPSDSALDAWEADHPVTASSREDDARGLGLLLFGLACVVLGFVIGLML